MADRVCLYALVAGKVGRLPAVGAGGERLRTVTVAGIEAVVGAVARAPKPSAATMRRYDAVERELMTTYASVVPARFGTCASSLDELGLSIRDRRVAIGRTLRLVRGRAQMTTRVFTSVQSALRTGSEYGDEATQGTQYLQRRHAAAQVPGAEPLRRAVARWVRAERVERHAEGRLAGSLYHLVPRGAATAYRRALERAALDAGLTVVVSGPWPPYAFADYSQVS